MSDSKKQKGNPMLSKLIRPTKGQALAMQTIARIRSNTRGKSKIPAPVVTLCMFCKRRKVSNDQWVEDEKHGTYPFGTISHGLCPECDAREYGGKQPPKLLSIGTISTPTRTPLQGERYAWAMLVDSLAGYFGSGVPELMLSSWRYAANPFIPRTAFGEGLIFNFSCPGLSDYVVKENKK